MLDFPLMLQVKLPVVDRIQPQNNKFPTGVENEAIGDSKLNLVIVRFQIISILTSLWKF